MSLLQIGVFAVLLLGIRLALPNQKRAGILAAASVLAAFWLQPATPLRNLDFWLPTLSLGLVLAVWCAVRPRTALAQNDLRAIALFTSLVVTVGLMRYLGPVCCLTATRPPPILSVAISLALGAALVASLTRLPSARMGLASAVLALVALFIVFKSEALTQATSAVLRRLSGQDPALASVLDLRWLGFSYLAFRLLHMLRDAQAGRSYPHSLNDTVAYALFTPSLTAGPIDRAPRFINELNQPTPISGAELIEASQRILVGIFKKFALADSLALFALSPLNAHQAQAGMWSWVLLYAYAFRIYFDFSGYTDIAIGLGQLAGIHLPENFAAPYLQTNLTNFWNRWHITLAQWFRAYFFNPFTRSLRQSSRQFPIWLIILTGQAGTMLLIGLWHGLTWNFAAWGAWHAAGLFIHNRWAEWLRPLLAGRTLSQPASRLLQAGGWAVTFHYVILGWVWFALPDPSSAGMYLLKLIGVGP